MCRLLLKAILIVQVSGLFVSCTVTTSPPRKRLPDDTMLSGDIPFFGRMENTPGLPFYQCDISLAAGGSTDDFVYVSMQDAGYDSLLMSLVNNYKPLAIPLLTRWAQQQHKGVLIDLRSSGNNTRRADYIIENTGNFSIPVILAWDQYSAGRAGTFLSVLQSVPHIRCRETSLYKTGLQDCFSGSR